MPLTATGRRVKRRFEREYGKTEGSRYFYAEINKYPSRTKSWHKGSLASDRRRKHRRHEMEEDHEEHRRRKHRDRYL